MENEMIEQEKLGILVGDSDLKETKNQNRCYICGCNHNNDDCNYLVITNHIHNRGVPSRARLSLPNNLKIDTLATGTSCIKSKEFIQKGTRFGPLEAAKTFTLNPIIQFPLKIFPYNDEDFLEYYLDTSNEQECTWMMFVEPADALEEQNLVCFQDGGYIYYATTIDILENECLKVWYSPYYAERMEKHILTKKTPEGLSEDIADVNNLLKIQQKILERESWTCKFCGMIKVNVTEFANHITEHYLAQLRKTCEICKATFISRKSLRKHTNIVHNPNSLKKTILSESPKIRCDRNISKEMPIGGPLLNNLELIDNFDNSNLLMPSLDHLNEDFQNMGTENLNFDNLLTENVRALDHFNFEIGDCQEEFVCDICVKSFTKLRSLVQHLKRHTGENVCLVCKKIFCRRENLLHHPCTGNPTYKCELCDRTFYQKKYYKKHIDSVHNKKFKCDSCGNLYCNKYELNKHNCKVNKNENQSYSCTICKKSYSHQINLRKHMLRYHSSENMKTFICSICAKQYMDKGSHDLHVKTHGEPKLQCEICDKKFFRKDVYQNHLKLHNNQEEEECTICYKKFNSKKGLYIHKKYHENIKFKCINCNVTCSNKSNLRKHLKTHQKSVKDIDFSSFYTCIYCDKNVKLKSSLVRHINRTHSEHKNEPIVEKSRRKETAMFTTETKNNIFMNNSDLDLMTNSKDNIDLMNDADMSELESNLQIQMIDNILLNTTKEMGIGFSDDLLGLTSLGVNTSMMDDQDDVQSVTENHNKEVCLSMPDLMDQDQDITLGRNAYILDNGTIVEPQENSDNVVVYVLNDSKV